MELVINSCSSFFILFLFKSACIDSVSTISKMDIFISPKVIHPSKESNSSEVGPRVNMTLWDWMEAATMTSKLRVKRQSGGGKYTDAAQMPQVRVLRLMLQMLRNTWADAYVGGVHPFHPEVPKPLVMLFREKIFKFFFPTVGGREGEEETN